jgi:hypothetical protein
VGVCKNATAGFRLVYRIYSGLKRAGFRTAYLNKFSLSFEPKNFLTGELRLNRILSMVTNTMYAARPIKRRFETGMLKKPTM